MGNTSKMEDAGSEQRTTTASRPSRWSDYLLRWFPSWWFAVYSDVTPFVMPPPPLRWSKEEVTAGFGGHWEEPRKFERERLYAKTPYEMRHVVAEALGRRKSRRSDSSVAAKSDGQTSLEISTEIANHSLGGGRSQKRVVDEPRQQVRQRDSRKTACAGGSRCGRLREHSRRAHHGLQVPRQEVMCPGGKWCGLDKHRPRSLKVPRQEVLCPDSMCCGLYKHRHRSLKVLHEEVLCPGGKWCGLDVHRPCSLQAEGPKARTGRGPSSPSPGQSTDCSCESCTPPVAAQKVCCCCCQSCCRCDGRCSCGTTDAVTTCGHGPAIRVTEAGKSSDVTPRCDCGRCAADMTRAAVKQHSCWPLVSRHDTDGCVCNVFSNPELYGLTDPKELETLAYIRRLTNR